MTATIEIISENINAKYEILDDDAEYITQEIIGRIKRNREEHRGPVKYV